MAENLDYAGIERFAQELVQGSRNALMAGQYALREALEVAYGRNLDMNRSRDRAMEELFPYSTSDRYRISPYSVEVVENEHGDSRSLSLGEFIRGTAVACGIEATDKEVEATIFQVGGILGKLARNG